MASLTVYGRLLNMQNGLFVPLLPTLMEDPERMATWSSSSIMLEYGSMDDGNAIAFGGTFTFETNISDFTTSLVTATVTSIVQQDWWHDYSTVPETYHSSEWQLSGISVSQADYRTLTPLAFASVVLAGHDSITASTANDYLTGMAGNDTLTGNDGHDTLDGGTGADQMYGGKGDDHYYVDSAEDQVIESVNEGTDTIHTRISYSLLDATGVENLTLVGHADLNLRGNRLNNVLTGNGGSNIFNGGDGIDTASFAAAGSVQASLKTGKALGAGYDFFVAIENLRGSRFGDRLEGDRTANLLQGDGGRDLLFGGAGADTLQGGKDKDRLTGGDGRDILTGGAGADVFDFNTPRESGTTAATRDIITDFSSIDRIDLRTIDAIAGGNNNAFGLIARMGTANSAVGPGKIGWYQIDNPGTANDRTILRLNTDRDAQIEMTIELSGLHVMKAGMFIL
ncbi:calcium-binding protein [Gemmobacter serpentinus]|uniref:calcium-binding protein n=1 Tax=Gemmobacter serpentinus TaxID=2652247 RepID=UPI00124DB081|nr:calcium-binding protein [Gemmobacter serpentinus]